MQSQLKGNNLENRTPLLEGVRQEINILKACKRIEELYIKIQNNFS